MIPPTARMAPDTQLGTGACSPQHPPKLSPCHKPKKRRKAEVLYRHQPTKIHHHKMATSSPRAMHTAGLSAAGVSSLKLQLHKVPTSHTQNLCWAFAARLPERVETAQCSQSRRLASLLDALQTAAAHPHRTVPERKCQHVRTGAKRLNAIATLLA